MLGKPPLIEKAYRLAKETKAFLIKRNGNLVMFTYAYVHPVMADPEARELRGIIYDSVSGNVVSRPFHKFFNYREPPFGLTREGFPDGEVYLAPKIDGYLLQVSLLDDGSLLKASRRSLSPTLLNSVLEEVWGEREEEATREVLERLPRPATLLFEVTSSKRPVLVRHQASEVRFLVAREIGTGRYLLPDEVGWPIEGQSLPWTRVRIDPDNFLEEIKDLEGVEGYVAFLPEKNEFVKFKTKWAFRLSGFLLDPVKGFVSAYVEDRVDDLLASLTERPDLQEAILRAKELLDGLFSEATSLGEELRDRGIVRKEAWEQVSSWAKGKGLSGIEGVLKEAAMVAYSGGQTREAFLKGIGKGKSVDFLKTLDLFPRVGEEVGA